MFIYQFQHLLLQLSRHRLLRCYLDNGDAAQARQLLDKYSSDTYSCCAYSRVLIEHIALSLEEEDASEEKRDQMMKQGETHCTIHSPLRKLLSDQIVLPLLPRSCGGEPIHHLGSGVPRRIRGLREALGAAADGPSLQHRAW